MPVRTRRQARELKSLEPERKYDDCWDIPESNLKSSIIKTYSKKQPFRKCWTSDSNSKITQESHHLSSKPVDSSVKPQRKKNKQEMSSKLPNNTPAIVRKAPRTQSISNNKTNVRSDCMASKSTTKRKRNKTQLAIESMTACSILPNQPSDINVLHEDMSLCSMANVQIKEMDNIRNSTVLDDCCHVNKDFVPNEISAIEGQTVLQDTVISNYNEQTPKEKPIQTPALSVKKVRFVSNNAKTPTTRKNCQPSAKRSILRKTPWRNKQSRDAEKCPQTSSPDPKKEFSMLNCEISTVLIDDRHPKKTRPKSGSQSYYQMTEDTEKLILDSEKLIEAVPLGCSEDFGENSRDVTPETCNTIKELTSSARRRRRLSYNFGKETPVCILLDYCVIKTKKKSRILLNEVAHITSSNDVKSFSYDMLL